MNPWNWTGCDHGWELPPEDDPSQTIEKPIKKEDEDKEKQR